MTNAEVLEDIQKTAIDLILTEAFYGHFFNNLNREVVDGKDHDVQTAAISMNPTNNQLRLLVNKPFWSKRIYSPDKQKWADAKYWLIKHEVLHILFKHIFNWHKFSDKTLANIAMDFVVHQCIDVNKIPEHLRPSLALIENFPDMFPNIKKGGSDSHQTTEYYYRKLVEERKKIHDTLKQDAASSSGQQNQGSGGMSMPSQGGNQQSDPNNGDEDGDDKQQGGGLEDNPNWDS